MTVRSYITKRKNTPVLHDSIHYPDCFYKRLFSINRQFTKYNKCDLFVKITP